MRIKKRIIKVKIKKMQFALIENHYFKLNFDN